MFESLAHFGFGIDAEAVGDAVDVIEVGNNLNRVEDIAVAQPVFAKRVEILSPDSGRRARQQLGEFAERFLPRQEFCSVVIVFDMFGQPRVTGFRTEILPVSLDSVKAMIGPGHDSPEHLALRPGQA